MASSPRSRARLTPQDYRTLADLRHHIRRFLHVRELAARTAGLEPQQYLLLLQIKAADGLAPTISHLAERLQVRHHSAVELVDRLVDRGLVARRAAAADRRQVVVELRPRGEDVLRRLASYSIQELRADGPALVTALTRLIRGRRPAARRAASKRRR